MNNPLFTDNTDAITHHVICNAKTSQQSLQHLEFHYVELSNFHKQIDELENDMDKWLYFLKNAESLETVPQNFKSSKDFTEAFHVLEKSLWTAKELEKYRSDLNRINREFRLQEGIFEEGAQTKATKVAENLIQEGFDTPFIVKMTELSIEQIEKLREKSKK